jgi:hypothetical protein
MQRLLQSVSSVKEINADGLIDIPTDILHASEPIILRGLVNNWPSVVAAKNSTTEAIDYIQQFYKGAKIAAFVGAQNQGGRYFYTPNIDGFNFEKTHCDLQTILPLLACPKKQDKPTHYYVGSANVEQLLPGFKQQNDLLALQNHKPLTSIWLGNKSRIAAHQDSPQNIACCIAGQRRFTLFAPEQIDNLYIGPLDFTPAGQAVSLVDFHQPDFERFPKFKQAQAVIAQLAPGDALVIPSLWWHHVEGLSDFNALVNFWWSKNPSYAASPFDAMLHSVLAIKHLSKAQKMAWQTFFQHYVFNQDDTAFDYLPEAHQGLLKGENEIAARQLRRYLLNKLNR